MRSTNLAFLPLFWATGCPKEPSAPVDSEDSLPPARVDADGDHWYSDDDCDDGDPAVFPGAFEVCNGEDDDCDGQVDEGLGSTWYRDADGDGWGDDATSAQACAQPSGYAATGSDCDDADPAVHPEAEEVCNGLDDDCDGTADEGLTLETWHLDADGDGWGGASTSVSACTAPSGYLADASDCDDTNAEIHPGASEACNARDDDCSGLIDDGAPCPCALEYDSGGVYMFCTVASDWFSARDVCQYYGYDLASAESAAEDAWLWATAATYRDGYWWIGGNDQTTEGTWKWSDGETWSYTHWCSGEPNNSHGLECVPTSTEEDCLVIAWGTSGCWNDYPCDCSSSEGTPYQYICEAR